LKSACDFRQTSRIVDVRKTVVGAVYESGVDERWRERVGGRAAHEGGGRWFTKGELGC
jgi:hypothetical protein